MEKRLWMIGVAALCITVGLSVGLYYAGYNADHTPSAKQSVFQNLQDEISASNIDTFLKHLSSVPHLAGTAQDLEQAQWLHDQFVQFGLDHVEIVPYEVLLSYPDMDIPNIISLMQNGQAKFNTSGRQEPLYTEEEDSTLVMPNFNAYSGRSGVTESNGLVYVNYGQEADYDYLAKQNINVSGNIVLARYGKSFRGNIVALAEQKKAVGVILFSDPKDFAQKGRDQIYPQSWWMPGKAVQSGTVMNKNGDPLTPFYPSIEGAYRIEESNAGLPSIPAQPIGYDEAEVLLQALKGQKAPDDWQGDLKTTYNLGPELESADMSIRMNILTTNRMATIYNTIGVLTGEEEPDRYVLVGNHRDAWSLGALDPSSGTACMLEMARAFGKMKFDHDWRPRRSLVFASWGAEEYGLIGSYEWVEEKAKVLSQRAVAYLNVDIAVEGNYSLRGNGAPLMNSLILESSKKIRNPNSLETEQGRTSLYDTWLKSFPDATYRNKPEVTSLGSGSDYTAFMHYLGIPSVDIRYTYEENIGSYPLYHTLYETHYLLADIMDPGFMYHKAITQMWAEMARNLTESIILPMDISWYATYLTDSLIEIKERYGAQLEANQASLKYFESAVSNFSTATQYFQDHTLSELNIQDLLAVRRVNDQLMYLERFFIDSHGLPDRPDYNHLVFAPSISDGYSSSSFAGLTDLLEAVGNQTEAENQSDWAKIKKHLSVIAFHVQAAAESLSDSL